MKKFTIVENTQVTKARYFDVEAESLEEAIQKIQDEEDENGDPIEPYRVDYDESPDSPTYYLDELDEE